MPKLAYVENFVTIIATVVLVLGLWAMGAWGWNLLGLLLLLNLNYPKQS